MTITITAFERSPDGKGLARDTRVRWALEEVGLAYEVRPVSFAARLRGARRGAARVPARVRGAGGVQQPYGMICARKNVSMCACSSIASDIAVPMP